MIRDEKGGGGDFFNRRSIQQIQHLKNWGEYREEIIELVIEYNFTDLKDMSNQTETVH